ncbi:Hypothetical predicted protein [Prunus dulcis]|uniref:TIR domain-containing protein n=3 Tax=Prunus dulcis TaxID=3755 RepID=A0A5E4EW37_PRUDU|nr:Hypothetical predicted protein [Prunus dulcis]
MDTSIVDEASSPSSSSCSTNDEMYDVFLSFIGVDSRKTFTDHLYWTLKDARVDVFIAENKLRGPKLMQAIEQSRIAVIIFSSGYAFSIGCLQELEKIMECRRTLGQMVLPIFYHVDPKNVGKQIDSFPVNHHGVKDWEEMMRSWRKSLIEATNLSGLVYMKSEGYEGMLIRKIVDEITRKLKSTCVDVVTEQVELDSSIQEISNDLKVHVGKDSRLQEISTRLDIGGPKDAHIQPQGPRPTAFKVNKASVKIKKRPPHAVVKRCRTVVIQANPSEFRSLVQRFTSTSSSPSSGDGGLSPAARLASINKTSLHSSSTSDHKKPLIPTISSHDEDFMGSICNNLEDLGRGEGGGGFLQIDETRHFPGLLSPAPASLPPIPNGFFSHEHDGALVPSPTGAGQIQKLSSSPDCLPARPKFPPSPR